MTGKASFDLLTDGGDVPFLGLSDMTYGPEGVLWVTDSGSSRLGQSLIYISEPTRPY